MDAITTMQTEGEPNEWPAVTGLSPAAAALDPGPLWQRLEGRMAHRFAPRQVVWQVTGPGVWRPPLAPVTELTFERWGATAWEPAEAQAAALGFRLASGDHRITATVGEGPPPAVVLEAFRRLAEYSAHAAGPAGASSFSESIDGASLQVTRAANWRAKAVDYSGAGDLLRAHRRA